VADDAVVGVLGLRIGMLAGRVCDFGFDRLGEKGTCAVAQDFCELIVEDSWLNQLDDVIVDTAYRSFGGEVEASSTPTICRLPDSRRHQLWAIAPDVEQGVVNIECEDRRHHSAALAFLSGGAARPTALAVTLPIAAAPKPASS